MSVLARQPLSDVAGTDHGGRHTPPGRDIKFRHIAYTGAPKPICGSAVCSPGLLPETRFWLCESHTNRSLNFRPSSFNARCVIEERTCISALPTPTAKKASAFAEVSD